MPCAEAPLQMAGWKQAGVPGRDVIVGRDIKIPQFAAACCGQAVVADGGRAVAVAKTGPGMDGRPLEAGPSTAQGQLDSAS